MSARKAKASFWQHIIEQPFIAATAGAALVHSAWSLGTLFSGAQPTPPQIGDSLQLWFEFGVKTLAWHVPAVAIAFAFDVGQVVTAHEIRHAHARKRRPWAKYATFVVFAAATYYLQLLYAAHHIPALVLGEGVGEAHRATIQAWVDMAVWLIPLLLPLSTVMYTLSGAPEPEETSAPANTPDTIANVSKPNVVVSRPVAPAPAPTPLPQAQEKPELPAPEEPAALPAPRPPRKRKQAIPMDAKPSDLFGDWKE